MVGVTVKPHLTVNCWGITLTTYGEIKAALTDHRLCPVRSRPSAPEAMRSTYTTIDRSGGLLFDDTGSSIAGVHLLHLVPEAPLRRQVVPLDAC